MYKLIQYENLSKKEFGMFVKSHAHGNIFQTPEMYEVYSRTKNYEPVFVGLVDSTGNLVGTLVSAIQKEFGGPLGIFSSRCVTWGGPLIKENIEDRDKKMALDTMLKYQNEIAGKKSIYMQFRNLWDMSKYRKAFERYGYAYEDHLDIFIDLTKSEEELWSQMKKNRRKSVKKAKKANMDFSEYDESSEFEAFFELIKNTYERVKIPLADISLFLSAISVLRPKDMAHFFCVKKEDKMIASRIVLTYKDIVYDWYAGSNEEGNREHANEYLVWNIFLWAKERGYSVFDFGGAGNPHKPYGPREFKLRFGGEVVNYGRYQNVFKKRTLKMAEKGLEIMKKLK